ncbi:restriction endonuclease subunit S [Mesobacillus jeotgali]|uniref:restriction endonuclease subunit S n=1 Tax=Mesobacillus jeotgali TaxID=129985 RepID=UPI000C83EB60|nr:restriction endonuclease subunit S [Mesobacillus jeotgali]
MRNHYLVPYKFLDRTDSWTVENLMFENNQEEERTPLNNLVTFNKERINTQNIDHHRDYPYIEIKSIELETGGILPTFIKGADLPTRAKLIGRTGDILLSIVRPERGIIAIVPSSLDGCVVSNTFVVLTPKKISSEYIYLLLKDNDVRQEFSLMARGTTTPTLGIKELKNYSLPLNKVPMYMEKTAKELYGEWRKRGIESRSLKEIVEDIFVKELLEAEIIDEEYTQSSYLTLPYENLVDRWDVKYHINHSTRKVLWDVPTYRVGDLGELQIGIPISAKSEKKGGLPYIRVQDLDDESLYVLNEELVYIVDESVEEKLSKAILVRDNILISRIGNFGRSALVQQELDGAVANHNLAILRLKEGEILPKFLAYFLKTKWAKQQFSTYATGLVLQANFLKELTIPVPSLEQQQLIVEFIEQKISANRIDELEKETLRFKHQIECVEKVYKSFIRGDKRGVVQLATGAGKTSIITALIRRLIELKQVKRVLYLADRRILAEQFRQAFKEKSINFPCYSIKLDNVKSDNGVWIGVINEVNQISNETFDLIILDGFSPAWSKFHNEETKGYVLGITSTTPNFLQDYNEGAHSWKHDEPLYVYTFNQAILDNLNIGMKNEQEQKE